MAGEALGLAWNAAEAFPLTPIVIAIHRFVILDRITRNYTVPIGEPAFAVFFGWLLALKILIGLPFDLLGALQTLDWPVRASTLVFALALIAAVGMSLRLTILLPALAVEAPGASPWHALADTKGNTLRILGLFLLGLLPWLAASFAGGSPVRAGEPLAPALRSQCSLRS